jgi:SAM-dependent methyltransferase
MTIVRLHKTRDVVEYTAKFVKGETLDLGAGNAKYRHIIKPKTSKYVTFDMVPGPHIDIVGDILNFPIPDESFDTVVSTQVLEHVRKPWVMASEIGRVLRKNGIVIASAPFLVPYHADPHDYFRYTKEGMSALFTENGFEVVECGSYGGFFSVVYETIHFTLFNPYKGKSSKQWQVRILRYLEKGADMLDRLFTSRIIYANVYVVARKM